MATRLTSRNAQVAKPTQSKHVWSMRYVTCAMGANAAAACVWCDTDVAAQVMVFLPTARLTQLYAEVFQRMQVRHMGM